MLLISFPLAYLLCYDVVKGILVFVIDIRFYYYKSIYNTVNPQNIVESLQKDNEFCPFGCQSTPTYMNGLKSLVVVPCKFSKVGIEVNSI